MTRDEAYNYLRCSGMSAEQIKTVVEALQPEPCEDAISRQAAENALCKMLHDCFFADEEELDAVTTTLDELPSVQPEQRWIPVSERTPEEDDYKSCIECFAGAVWYFTKNGTMGLGYYYKSTKEWSTIDDLKTDGKVVAWMPLPEPYEPKENK